MRLPFSRSRREGSRLPQLNREPGDSENAALVLEIRKEQPTVKEVLEALQKGFPNHRHDELYIVRAEKGTIIIVADMNIVSSQKL